MHRPEEGAPALVVEDQDDGGLGQVGRVVPMLALFLPEIRDRSVEADLVRDELVEAVDTLELLLLRLLVHGQGVGLAHLSGARRDGPHGRLEIALLVRAWWRKGKEYSLRNKISSEKS